MFSRKILNLDHTKILSTFLGRRNDMSKPPWHHRPHSRCHFCLYSYHVLSIQAAWYIAHRNLPPYNIKKAYWYIFSTLSMIIFISSFSQISNILMTITIPLHNHIRLVFDISHVYYRVGHILEFYMDLNCSSGPHLSILLYKLFPQIRYKYIALATIKKLKFIFLWKVLVKEAISRICLTFNR